MVEDEINTKTNDWDGAFVSEMKQRSQSFTNGTAKAYSWEETKKAARERVNAKNKW
jgi:hypothetical protein